MVGCYDILCAGDLATKKVNNEEDDRPTVPSGSEY
jgi:hypothetical protein